MFRPGRSASPANEALTEVCSETWVRQTSVPLSTTRTSRGPDELSPKRSRNSIVESWGFCTFRLAEPVVQAQKLFSKRSVEYQPWPNSMATPVPADVCKSAAGPFKTKPSPPGGVKTVGAATIGRTPRIKMVRQTRPAGTSTQKANCIGSSTRVAAPG